MSPQDARHLASQGHCEAGCHYRTQFHPHIGVTTVLEDIAYELFLPHFGHF